VLTALLRARKTVRLTAESNECRMNWLVTHQRIVIRTLAWIGITANVILTVVPAVDRPVTGAGQVLEHFSAYALVAGVFAIGYRLSLTWLMLLAFLFCGLTELMQIPLPTRHARISDFIIDLAGAWFGIGVVLFINERLNLHSAEHWRCRLQSQRIFQVAA
jgi:VanZ like family